MKLKTIILWLLQLIVASILFGAAWAKLSSQPNSIYIFTELGMEPAGRFIIGVIECSAAFFLLTNRLAATGALFAVGTMLGAIIAHVSILGFSVLGDEGRHIVMLALVLCSALTVTIVRRRQLPLIGNTFGD